MSWRTTGNSDDNGVYLLRHLEVYMGEREGQWNCGLSTKNKGVFQYLRAKYNRVLMLARNNHSALLNKESASKHYAKESKKKKDQRRKDDSKLRFLNNGYVIPKASETFRSFLYRLPLFY